MAGDTTVERLEDSLWDPATPAGPFSGVKRSGHDGGHSPPYRAEGMNGWSYTSAPSYFFMTCVWAVCLFICRTGNRGSLNKFDVILTVYRR